MPYPPVKNSRQIVVDMINDEFNTSYALEDIVFGTPEAGEYLDGRNTRVAVSVNGGPLPGGHTHVFYHRLPLLDVIIDSEVMVPNLTSEVTSIAATLPYFYNTYNAFFEPDDVVDSPIDASAGDVLTQLEAAPDSFGFIGTFPFTVSMDGTDGNSETPGDWNEFSFENSFFADNAITGEAGSLYMTPGGQTLDGNSFYATDVSNSPLGLNFRLVGRAMTGVGASEESVANLYDLEVAGSQDWYLDILTWTSVPANGDYQIRVTVKDPSEANADLVFRLLYDGDSYEWVSDGSSPITIPTIYEAVPSSAVYITEVRFNADLLAGKFPDRATLAGGGPVGNFNVEMSVHLTSDGTRCGGGNFNVAVSAAP